MILTRPEEWEACLGGIRAEKLQLPLLDGALALIDEAI